MNKQPNILLLHTHDLGRFLEVYESGARCGVISPYLKQLAREGVVFTNAFCHSPLCSPSRSTLFTGRYSHSNGVMGLAHKSDEGWRYVPGEKTIPGLLGEAGYATYLFGQQHEAENSRTLGYDEIVEYGDPGQPWCHEVADRFVDFLRSDRAQEKPFFASVGFYEPHRIGRDYPPEMYPFETEDAIEVPSFLKDCPEVREDLAGFFGAIQKADMCAGRIMDVLQETGLAENTWVIFTTDHGAHFPRAKETLFDKGLEISLIMRWPGQLSEGAVFDSTVGHVDFLPTLLDALGLQKPANLQGRSYWAALRGQEPLEEQPVFSEKNWMNGYHPLRAVRADGFKLIRSYAGPAEFDRYRSNPLPTLSEQGMNYQLPLPHDGLELYDLTNDPDELINLAGQEKLGDIERKLAALLDEWMEGTSDPLLEGPVPTRLQQDAHRLGLC